MRLLRQKIFFITVTLLCIGVVMVYSASAIYAGETFHDSAYFLKRHVVSLVLSLVAAFAMMAVDLQTIQRNARIFVLISIALLILLFIPGFTRTIGGARRWLRFGVIGFQPSEVAKLAMIIYLADFCARKGSKINDLLKGFLPPAAVLSVLLVLMLLQPDLGRSAELVALSFLLFFLAGFDLRYIGTSILVVIPGLYLAVWNVPYRRQRILSFLNPWSDSQGAGFQMVQSYLALGSGGWRGIGLGASIQKLFYLPEAHTDFIFSIIGEELGLLGSLTVSVLFLLFFVYGIRMSMACKERFSGFLIFGVTVMITLEALINIGVATGLLPTKGLPLPFISYGGSALVVDLMAVGLLLNASRNGE